jgi:LL-diaminopimelate aminotransferase
VIRTSERLSRLPAYAVAELAAIKRRLLAEGRDVIDLGAGDADSPPPEPAQRALAEAVADPAMSRYAYQVGLREFREAATRYLGRRFGAEFDPTDEVLPLLGSKEGLAHLPLAFVNPGEVCVLPDPGYPAYLGGTLLADAEPLLVPLRAERNFLIELEDLPPAQLERVRLVFLNYPNNPTTAVAPRDYLERTVRLCRERGILIAYDNPYVELTFDGYRAPSIFEIDGARECAIEFHSVSKTFSMTGWRLAWAAAARDLLAPLQRLKTWTDTGVFLAIQKAGAAVLDRAEELAAPLVAELERRRDTTLEVLAGVGLSATRPRATMYVWVRLPEGITAQAFGRTLLEREAVVVLPGTGFGSGGEGYFRIALTVQIPRLREAVERIGRVVHDSAVSG